MEAKRTQLMKQNREALQSSSNSARLTSGPSTSKTLKAAIKPTVSSQTAAPPGQKSFEHILRKGKNFKPVRRISVRSLQADTIQQHDESGEPLIIEGFHELEIWPGDVFNVEWLLENHGNESCCVRDVHKRSDQKMTLSEFIEHTRKPASEARRPLYYKDAHCPPEWSEWVQTRELIPSALRPHNDNDLLRYLTTQETVESLMCYLGAGGTLTPCHKDLCGSSGHNIMCYTENNGSSVWFMTATSDAPTVGAFFQDQLKSEVDWERCTVTAEQFAKVPCTVYLAEQKLGDLILVPPRSCHQVINRGGLTIKTSWSRMTVKGLAMALHHELPIYRRVCRPEQYRVKYIVYRSMLRLHQELSGLIDGVTQPGQIANLLHDQGTLQKVHDVVELLRLFDSILLEEFIPAQTSTMFSDEQQILEIFQPRSSSKRKPKPSSHATRAHKTSCNFACDFCGSDIFQSFFECQECTTETDEDEDGTPGVGDGLILCSSCYVEGRTCACGSMTPAQCRPFNLLLDTRNKTAGLLRRFGEDYKGHVDLNVKTLREGGKMRTSEAAYLLWKARTTTPNQGKQQRSILTCRHKHTVKRNDCLNCTSCHANYCYEHLLTYGVHSIEAILLRKEGCGVQGPWHKCHTRVREELTRSSTGVRDAERIEDPLQRQAMVALHYPRCSSLNPEHTQPGWYDDPVSEAEAPSPSTKSTQAADVHEAESSGSIEQNSPSKDKGKAPLRRRGSESSLSSLSDVPPAKKPGPAVSSRRKEVFDCVLVPPRPKRPSTDYQSDSDRPIKRQKRGPKPVKKPNVTADSDEDDRRVEEDYGRSLAQALESANADPPQFSPLIITGKGANQRIRLKPPVPPTQKEPAAGPAPVASSSKDIAPTDPSNAQASSQDTAVSQAASSASRKTLDIPRTKIRGKRGRPPGRRAPVPADESQTATAAPETTHAPPDTPAAAESSRLNPQQSAAGPTLPSPSSLGSSSASKPRSRATEGDDSAQKVLRTLQQYEKKIEELTKEVQSQTKRAHTLESRLDEETQQRAALERSLREKEKESERFNQRFTALSSKLAEETKNREQITQQIREDVAKRDQALKTQIESITRQTEESGAKLRSELVQRNQPQPGPSAPTIDPNVAQQTLLNLVAAATQNSMMLGNNAVMAPYQFSQPAPGQQLLTHAQIPAAPMHGQQPRMGMATSGVYAHEVQPAQVYNPHTHLQEDPSPPRGRSPYANGVSLGKRRASRAPSRPRGDYDGHDQDIASPPSQDETAVEEVDHHHHYRHRTAPPTRTPSHRRIDRSEPAFAQARPLEGQASRPVAVNHHRYDRGNRSGYVHHGPPPPTPQHPRRDSYPTQQRHTRQ